MRKLSIIAFLVLMFSLLLSGMTQASLIDVTAPGDMVKGVPDDANSWPIPNEAPDKVIDNRADTKYLNFRGATETTGFQVTASLGGMIVNEMTLTTGNDSPERDPVIVEIYGSNDSIDGPYTLIDVVDVVDFNQAEPWPRNKKNETPILFDNDVAYDHYQVLFTAVRVFDNGCCMQISEVELLSTVPDLTGWVYKDIDTTGGNAWEDAGTFIIRADGYGISDSPDGFSDGFGYMFRPLSGDGSLEVKITSMDLTDPWAKAGVMIRETSAADSKFVFMAMTAENGVQSAFRSSTGGGCAQIGITAGQTVPEKLRLTRVGDEFTAQYAQWMFGSWQWATQGTTIIPMDSDVLIGLAVSSHSGLLCTSVFDEMVSTIPAFNGPWNMEPADGSTHLSTTPTLTWLPGDSATSHDVYLGTDSAALDPAGTKPLGDESYTPGTPLLAGTTYYWQIVEQPGDYAGPVFSFSTLYEAPWWTGTINWERWRDMWWEEIERMIYSARYMQPPDDIAEYTEAYSGDTDVETYGVRMSGHLVPGTSGDYTFWIAADDGSELRLNTNNDVADLAKICGWYRYSGNFDAHPEQMSATIPLVGGQKYAIQILLKEGGGGDWVDVAWQGPDAPSRTRITGTFLTTAFAVNPKPASRANLTPLEAETLSWTAGKYATQQEVLFGTDPGAMVSIATPSADPMVPVETTTLPMPAVASGNTYYWQVNSTDGTEVWEGDVWSFTVSDWVSIDIGSFPRSEDNPIIPPGSHTYDEVSGIHTINADGGDVWGEWDEFHYYYTTMKLTRDIGEVKARVLSVPQTDDWAKAGVMIRESLAATSRHAFMVNTKNEDAGFQRRPDTRGGSAGNDWWGVTAPTWVRIERDHNWFTGYWSNDDENWNYVGGDNIWMEPDKYVYIGLATTSHSAGNIGTATFDNLSISMPDPLQAWGPTPRNGEENVPLYTTLSWGAGDDADEHRLYFSDNYNDVYYGLVAPIVLPAGTTEYAVGPLDLTKPYYWAVDEVIQEGRPWPVTLGDIWSFRIEDYRLVEDFEPYGDAPVPIEELPEQVVIDGGYTIPGYTIYSVEPTDDCLLADYQFEGDANDSSGNGRDGMLVGDANVLDGVLDVDGDGDCVDLGNDPNFNFAGNFSISGWVNLRSWGGGWGNVIISKRGDDGVGWQIRRFGEDENLSFTTRGIDNDDYPRSNLSPSLDQWYHIAAIRDGDKKLLYINGELDGTADVSTDSVAACDHNVYVGARANADNNDTESFFDGMVDDLQIYCRALSQGEVRYLNGLPDLVIPDVVVPPVYGPMIAYYKADGDANDSSGNNFHGTPMGDVTIVDDAVRGYVATFDGDGDAVNIGNDPMFNPGYDDFSISVWINMSSYGGNWSNVIIGKRGESGLSWQIRRLSDTHRISFTTRGGGDEDGWGPGGQDVSLNEWHHVAAVRQGLQKWLYIDGQQEAISDAPEYIPSDDYNVYIGARANGDNTGPESFFNGMIDEVRYYKDIALTWGEVLNLLEYDTTNPIHDTWSENGAALSLDYFEKHWDAKSMKVDIGSTGEVSRSTPFGDWDSGNAKAMVLYFKGDPGNVIDDMYMALATSASAQASVITPASSFSYDGDMNDLKSGDWTEWNIDVTGITGVQNMAIGLSGEGTVNFDDMRLYPPRCRAEYGPLADFTGDCLVDARDVRVMAGDWLGRDYTIYAEEPDVAGLVARYEFDGDVNDTSGNGHDGTIYGAVTTEDDPDRGMVLSLPGGDDQYVALPEVGISGNDPTTITCWAKADNMTIPDWTLVFGFSTPGGDCGSHFNIGSIGGPGGVGAHAWCFEDTIFTDEEALEWRHYAMTFDGTTITYYGDGVQVGQTGMDLSIRGDYVNIGKRNTQASSFPGKVDDARIYNYQLSNEEVVGAMGLSEVYVPIESIANLYDEEPANSRFINFKDYATLMEEWLYQQLWP